jgi:murein DD-endopeptidase MepM/ murein hydrolase activator NlpD
VPHAAAAVPTGFIFGHGGRQFRFGHVGFWSLISVFGLMAAWTLATASYFAFHDDLLTRLIARQAQMQYGYEDRIAELRTQIDRLASRQLLDQEQYEHKLDQLAKRESMLESRSAIVDSLSSRTSTGSVQPPPTPGGSREPALGTQKPSPISDTLTIGPSTSWNPHRAPRSLSRSAAADRSAPAASIDAALAGLDASLTRIELSQVMTLSAIEEGYGAKSRRIRTVLSELGVDPNKAPAAATSSRTGGPFVAARPPPANDVFERQLYRISIARSEVELLNRTLVDLPLRRPLAGETDVTSGFGVRLDPFLRRPAVHTGMDFRGEEGEPIYATAAGTVIHAGWSGGYGRMVEIDHGNGFATRYGHLLNIDVQIGEPVRSGQVIGHLGSTGPHLHYETRVDGEAVDPERFLGAGVRLGGQG